MANFTLTQNATNVNNAINNVHNAQTTPTSGSALMVTSGGVHTALNNITVTGGDFNLAAAAFTTSSAGLSSNDVDTKLPTNKAVKAYVDQNTVAPGFYQYTTTALAGATPSSKAIYLSFTETADITGNSTLSNTSGTANDTITITDTGVYQFYYTFTNFGGSFGSGRRAVLMLSTSVNNASYVDKQMYTVIRSNYVNSDDASDVIDNYNPRLSSTTSTINKGAFTDADARQISIVNSNAGQLKVQLRVDTYHLDSPNVNLDAGTLTIVKIA